MRRMGSIVGQDGWCTYLVVEYAKASTTPATFKDACVTVAALVADPYPDDGIDFSEVQKFAKFQLDSRLSRGIRNE